MILKKIVKDKKFCKWLIANRDDIVLNASYVAAVLQAYKMRKPIKQVQKFLESKKKLSKDDSLKSLKELFKKDLERFFAYLNRQKSDLYSYRDYLKACEFLGLDMTVGKNRYPHDFKHWHDIRIDQYHTAKALADEKERPELHQQFKAVAKKYSALQNCKKGEYVAIVAASITELFFEGEILKHCVGKMNYENRVVREESLIFFIRSSNSPDVPFVTVEYSLKSKKVLQCYGFDSKRPNDEVVDYVHNTWLPYANRTIKKIGVAERKAA
jgi:hypothetical protein